MTERNTLPRFTPTTLPGALNPGDRGGGMPSASMAPGDVDAAVHYLQERVATRIAGEGDRFEGLDEEAAGLRTQALVVEELELWVRHRAETGQPAPSVADEDTVVDAVLAALGGLGRLEPLLARTDIEDIFFTGCEPTVLRLTDGTKITGPPLAETDSRVLDTLRTMASSMGGEGGSREFSTARPLMSVRLKAVGALGARLSAVTDVTPRPSGTIRIHGHVETSLDQVKALGTIDSPLHAFLTAAVLAEAKIMVSGSTGAGKTTLLRALCAAIPLDRMIVTVEDDRELGLHVLPQRDRAGEIVRDGAGRVVPLRPAALVRSYEARPPNSEGVGQITMGDCCRQALRDSPDVLVVGETRGADVVHILDAATNGIAGVMCTMHAQNAHGVFSRIVQNMQKVVPPLPVDFSLRAATGLDLIVHVRKNRANQRFVSEVLQIQPEVLGDNGLPVTEHLFAPGPDGRAAPTGHRPRPAMLERLEAVGFDTAWLSQEASDWVVGDGAQRGGWAG